MRVNRFRGSLIMPKMPILSGADMGNSDRISLRKRCGWLSAAYLSSDYDRGTTHGNCPTVGRQVAHTGRWFAANNDGE